MPLARPVFESRFVVAGLINKTSNEATLFVRDWRQIKADAPSIVIMHGLGEHCGRYLKVAQFLFDLGFSVRTFDLRGHGQSTGKRGDVPQYISDEQTNADSIFAQDAEQVIGDFAKQTNSTPFLLGHSMGGLFAAQVALRAQVKLRGLILSSPAFALRLSGIDKILLKIMRPIAPHLAVANGLKTRYLSHDPQTVDAYINDPLVHNRITPSLLSAILSAIDNVKTQSAELNMPVLMLVAGDDYLVNPEGSHDFFAAIKPQHSQNQAHFYADWYHEIFNEIDAQAAYTALQNWLQMTTQPNSTTQAAQ